MIRSIRICVKYPNGKTKEILIGKEVEELVKKIRKLGDLGTDNFGRLLEALFKLTDAEVTESTDMVDETGTTRSIEAKRPVSAYLFNTTNSYECGSFIVIGTGTTPPTRGDYAPESEIDRRGADAQYIPEYGFVSVRASFTLAQDATISEVALVWKEGLRGYTFLFDRTVLDTPIDVTAGSTITVEYRIYI